MIRSFRLTWSDCALVVNFAAVSVGSLRAIAALGPDPRFALTILFGNGPVLEVDAGWAEVFFMGGHLWFILDIRLLQSIIASNYISAPISPLKFRDITHETTLTRRVRSYPQASQVLNAVEVLWSTPSSPWVSQRVSPCC